MAMRRERDEQPDLYWWGRLNEDERRDVMAAISFTQAHGTGADNGSTHPLFLISRLVQLLEESNGTQQSEPREKMADAQDGGDQSSGIYTFSTMGDAMLSY